MQSEIHYAIVIFAIELHGKTIFKGITEIGIFQMIPFSPKNLS